MNKTNRPPATFLLLRRETLKQLSGPDLRRAAGAGIVPNSYQISTIVFSEGACETYSWAWRCAE